MAEEIRLVGVFNDGISPKLKILDKNLKKVTKSFTRVSKGVRRFTTEAAKAEKAIERLNRKVTTGMRKNAKSVGTAAGSWDRYTSSIKKADRAARNFRPPNEGKAPRPMRTPRGRGRGRYTATRIDPPKIPGFGTIAAAGVAAGLALEGLAVAARLASGALGTIVQGVKSFQQMETQLAGTFQVLGNMDWTSALNATNDSLKQVEDIAVALPGSTMDFMSVFSQTFDDQVTMFGGVAQAQADLAKGDKSFTALFGLAAQIAGIPANIAAQDINQLREAPEQLRNIQIINRNAVLRTKYLEELAKNGGDGVKALAAALPQSITQNQIDQLRGGLDAQIQEFIATIYSPTRGLLGGLREIEIDGSVTTFGRELTKFFAALKELSQALMATGADPMKPIIRFVQWLTGIAEQMATTIEGGGSILDGIADFFGNIGAGLINFATSLDYTAIVQAVDRFFFTLFSGIDYGALGQSVLEIITAALQSPTGLVLAVAGLVLLINKIILAFTALQAAMAFIQGLQLGATIAGWLGAIGPAIAAIGTAMTAVVLPVLAVAGGIMLLIAVVRHFDLILSSTVEALKILGNAIKWVATYYKEGVIKMISAVLGIVNGLAKKLGLGWLAETLGLGKAQRRTEKELQQTIKDRRKIEREIGESASRIAENTNESFRRTGEDMAELGNMFNQETNALEDATRPTARAMESLRRQMEKAGSTYRNNQKFVDDAGKAWGHAMLDGKQIIVEWGSVAGTSLDQLTTASENAADALNSIETPTIPEITPPKLPENLTDPTKPLDVSGISDALTEINGVAPVEVVIPEIKPMEQTSILGEMVTGLNNWWNDRQSEMSTYNDFVRENPLPEAPKVEVIVGASEFPEPIDIAPVTQGLTQLEGKQTEAINKISKTNSILRNVKGKVEQSGKDVTAAIDKSSAANSTALNNVQFALNTISSKLTAPFDVKVIGKVTIANLPKDRNNDRRTGNNGQPLDVDPLVSPPFDPNAYVPPLTVLTKIVTPAVITPPTVLADIPTPRQDGRKPLMEILDGTVVQNQTVLTVSTPPAVMAEIPSPTVITPPNVMAEIPSPTVIIPPTVMAEIPSPTVIAPPTVLGTFDLPEAATPTVLTDLLPPKAEQPSVLPQFKLPTTEKNLPAFMADERREPLQAEKTPVQLIEREMFSQMASQPSMVSELIPATTTTNNNGGGMAFNGNLNISMSGVEKNGEDLANEVAGYFMTAIQQATFTELDIT